MGAGRVLLRQPERGRRASKIHAIKTNNLAGADLDVVRPVNRPTGLKMYECLQARVYLVWGCFWMSFQDVYWLHGTIFSFYNYWGVHTHIEMMVWHCSERKFSSPVLRESMH